MTSRVSLLSSTAIAAAAIVFAGASASAASMDALEKRVKALEKAGAGKSVSRSKKTMKLTLSGQLHRSVQYVDNGVNTEFRHTQNQSSSTRFRFVGTGKITDDVSIRTLFEWENDNGSSPEQGVTIDEKNDAIFVERHQDIQITSKSMGKLYLGHGSEASDGVVYYTDLSGTTVAAGPGNHGLNIGGETFVTSTGAGAGVGTAEASNLDGGRIDRIRYDTPSFAGFNLNVSHSNQDSQAIALRYGGSFSGVRVRATVSYDYDSQSNSGNGAGGGDDTTIGTLGVLLPMGLNFSVNIGQRDFNTVGAQDLDYQWYKIGYRFKGSELGETRLAAVWTQSEDEGGVDGTTQESWSANVVQVIEPLGAELWASYTNVEQEVTGVTDIQDIDAVTVGLRVRF